MRVYFDENSKKYFIMVDGKKFYIREKDIPTVKKLKTKKKKKT